MNLSHLVTEVTLPVYLRIGVPGSGEFEGHVGDLVLPWPLEGAGWRSDLADLLRELADEFERPNGDASVSSDAARWTPETGDQP